MRKRLGLLAAASALVVSGVACSGEDASVADIKEPKVKGRALPTDYSAQAPDLLTVFFNVDGHPNVVKLCLDGLGFRTLSSSHSGGMAGAAERIPEWDAECEKLQGTAENEK